MGLFNRIKLETPESVELEFNLAGIGNRAYALCIDYLYLGLILILVLIIWAFVSLYLVSVGQLLTNNNQVGLWLLAIQLLIMFTVYVGYFVFFETLWQGQTPGKRSVKIRVISDDGTIITLTQAILRSLLRPIDDLFFIGVYLIIFTKLEKRIGDLVAGTLVIKQEEATDKPIIAIAPEADVLAKNIQGRADVSHLLPEDFTVVKEFLQRRQQMTPEARKTVSMQVAMKIREKIGLETIPEGISLELFLEAIYLLYRT